MMAALLVSPQCRAIVPATGMTAMFLPTREAVERMKRQLGIDQPDPAAAHGRDESGD